jgi:GTP-binding protein
LNDWQTINRELALFDAELAKKPQIVVANKIDLPEGRKNAQLLARKLPAECVTLYAISAATHEGVRKLVQAAGSKLEAVKRDHEAMHDAARA